MCRRKEKTERKRARERDIKQKAQRGRSRRASLTLRAGLRRREHLKVNTAEGVTEKRVERCYREQRYRREEKELHPTHTGIKAYCSNRMLRRSSLLMRTMQSFS